MLGKRTLLKKLQARVEPGQSRQGRSGIPYAAHAVQNCFADTRRRAADGVEPKGHFYEVISSHNQRLAYDAQARSIVTMTEPDNASTHRLVSYSPSKGVGLCAFLGEPAPDWLVIGRSGRAYGAPVFLQSKVVGENELYAFLYLGNRRYLSSPPTPPGAQMKVIANRIEAKSWEFFSIVPTDADYNCRLKAHILDNFLENTKRIDFIIDVLTNEKDIAAWTLNTLSLLLSDSELAALVQAMLDAPSLMFSMRHLFEDDVWASIGFSEVFRVLSEAPEAEVIRTTNGFLPYTLDHLCEDGFFGEHVSLSYRVNMHARRLVRPARNLCVLASARNEGIYLIEWIAYHKTIGADGIILYSNNNDDGSDVLLSHLAMSGEITWIRNNVGVGRSAQRKAYGHALSLLPDILSYEWALLIDIDEFFVFDRSIFPSLSSYLNFHAMRQTDAVAHNWVFLSSDGQREWLDAPLTSRFKKQLNKGRPDPHVKTLLRTNCFGHSSPHFPRTPQSSDFIFRDSLGRIHSYKNSTADIDFAPAFSDFPARENACVYHYFFKSAEEFLWKISRSRGDHALRLETTIGNAEHSLIENFLQHYVSNDTISSPTLQQCSPDLQNELDRLRSLPGVRKAEEDCKARFTAGLDRLKAELSSADHNVLGDAGARLKKIFFE